MTLSHRNYNTRKSWLAQLIQQTTTTKAQKIKSDQCNSLLQGTYKQHLQQVRRNVWLEPLTFIQRKKWGLETCSIVDRWLGGVVVSVSDSRSRGPGFDSRPVHCQATTLGKLLTPMCLRHQAVQFGTGQRAVMLCSREGNRRSGVALAMLNRLQWFIHLRAHSQSKGDEHPTYVHSGMVRFTLP